MSNTEKNNPIPDVETDIDDKNIPKISKIVIDEETGTVTLTLAKEVKEKKE